MTNAGIRNFSITGSDIF